VRYHDRQDRPWEYGLWYSRHIDRSYIENAWPPNDVIHEEKVGNTTIGAVTKRRSDDAYKGFLAKKENNLQEAIGHFEKAIQLDAENEGAWISLGECYRAIGENQKALNAFSKALEINPEHTVVLGLQGSTYAGMNDLPKAKAAFEKAVKTNYKYNFAYYLLAQIEAQTNPAKALEYIELHDKHNGNIPQAYDIGIQLAKQQGKRAMGLYFEAKSAYLKRDGQTALTKLNQALQADKNYEPAVKLKAVFDELQKKEK